MGLSRYEDVEFFLDFVVRPAPGETKGGGASLLFLLMPPVLLLVVTRLGDVKPKFPVDLFPFLAVQLGATTAVVTLAVGFFVGLLVVSKFMFCFLPSIAVAAANWLLFRGSCLRGAMVLLGGNTLWRLGGSRGLSMMCYSFCHFTSGPEEEASCSR